MSIEIKLVYKDGYVTGFMSENQLKHWLCMNEHNRKGIIFCQVLEKMSLTKFKQCYLDLANLVNGG